MQKQISEYSEIELKAFGYENMTEITRLEMGLKAINEELTRRASEPKKVEEKPKTEAAL